MQYAVVSVLVFLLLVKGLSPVVFDYCICIMIPLEFHFLYRIRNPTFSKFPFVNRQGDYDSLDTTR